jgi:hypothetical protein
MKMIAEYLDQAGRRGSERMVAGSKAIEIAGVRITEAGRRALANGQ